MLKELDKADVIVVGFKVYPLLLVASIFLFTCGKFK